MLSACQIAAALCSAPPSLLLSTMVSVGRQKRMEMAAAAREHPQRLWYAGAGGVAGAPRGGALTIALCCCVALCAVRAQEDRRSKVRHASTSSGSTTRRRTNAAPARAPRAFTHCFRLSALLRFFCVCSPPATAGAAVRQEFTVQVSLRETGGCGRRTDRIPSTLAADSVLTLACPSRCCCCSSLRFCSLVPLVAPEEWSVRQRATGWSWQQ